MTPPFQLLSLGEVLWDLFPEGERFGGAPANFACHAAVLGADVTMASAVGEDDRGREAIEILESYGIDTRCVTTLPGLPTGTVGIALDDLGKPTFTIHEGSAWDHFPWTEALEETLASVDAIYFGTLGQRGVESRETINRAALMAAETGTPCLLDVNLRAPYFDGALLRASIERATLLKLSDEELPEVLACLEVAPNRNAEDALKEVREVGELDLVVMTRGAEGALLVNGDGSFDQPGIPTTVRDTVGAGDAFTAAFLVGHLAGDPPGETLRRACEIAAAVCARDGAVPELVASA